MIAQRIKAAQAELIAALNELGEADTAPDINKEPAWYLTARGELGVKEMRGAEHNERILEYLASCHVDRGGNLKDWGTLQDETAWCSAFVNWCVERTEAIRGTRSAWARSWEHWGVPLDRPRRGCIVLLERGAVGGSAHVTFYDRKDPQDPGLIHCLGGNQRNSVCFAPYLRSKVIAYRWPKEAATS